jgi:hypothetical protein
MTPKKFIETLAQMYDEKRSDVSEICRHFLETGEVLSDCTEPRFVKARIPNTGYEIEYDTLTTEMSYHEPLGQWEQCQDHDYYDE